ncbi:hypothetical protein J6X90_01565 [Candidatus Saccharibacteria bacterium]|nr:hypothetical protein [Candidatus Saccharibacteria bacterium]
MKIILVVLAINFLTCSLVRIIQGGRFVYNIKPYPDYNGKNVLIAGVLGQPEPTYSKIRMPYGGNGYLNYSLFGFNPKNAGKQLKRLSKTKNHIIGSKDYIIGLTVGCKAILYAGLIGKRRVLLSPYTHSIGLTVKDQTRLEYLTPILEVIAWALGWIAVLPIIRTKQKTFYSLALLADQLFWTYYGDPEPDENCGANYDVILDRDTDHQENAVMADIYKKARIATVATTHERIAEEVIAKLYETILEEFLVQKEGSH